MNKRVNLSKMNRIGVITVAGDRLYKDDFRLFQKWGMTATDAFFRTMYECNYKNGKECVLSMIDDENTVLGHFDNNAIVLLSENSVLAPTQFINVMVNLQESSNEMRRLIMRESPTSYSDFDLENLNINFANLELTTGMPAEVIKQYFVNEMKKTQDVSEIDDNEKVGSGYNTEKGIISHSHTSQYGINIMSFLSKMINVNPDIRLLMSNVHCYGTLPGDKTDKNNQFQVYPALKYIVENFGNAENINKEYRMRWDDGDPDNGVLAMHTSLNDTVKMKRSENDSNYFSPRTLQEVKEYMGTLEAKAHELSKSIEEEKELHK